MSCIVCDGTCRCRVLYATVIAIAVYCMRQYSPLSCVACDSTGHCRVLYATVLAIAVYCMRQYSPLSCIVCDSTGHCRVLYATILAIAVYCMRQAVAVLLLRTHHCRAFAWCFHTKTSNANNVIYSLNLTTEPKSRGSQLFFLITHFFSVKCFVAHFKLLHWSIGFGVFNLNPRRRLFFWRSTFLKSVFSYIFDPNWGWRPFFFLFGKRLFWSWYVTSYNQPVGNHWLRDYFSQLFACERNKCNSSYFRFFL